jgi:hypothetical protein
MTALAPAPDAQSHFVFADFAKRGLTEGAMLKAPIYAGIDPDAIKATLGFEVVSAPELIEKCPELIPGAVVGIRRHWSMANQKFSSRAH